MKNPGITVPRTALLLALLLAGCESTSDRIREKSAVYATLTPTEKDQVDRGFIMVGFTPDMVYMAMGNAAKVEKVDSPEGKSELWTYNNFYPSGGKGHSWYAPYSTDSHYQPSRVEAGTTRPRGVGTPQSISTTGGPQGSWSEPADLASYTLKVLFTDGKVSKVGLKAN